MPVIEGIRIPLNLYVVLKEPSLLAGMSHPGTRTPWEKIGDQAVSKLSRIVHLGHKYRNIYLL